MSQATVAPGGTVAGRPQPQTTAEPAGGPFVRHAPDGRRAQYVATTGASGFISNPTVSMPGYCKGYKLQTQLVLKVGSSTAVPVADFPDTFYSLVQMKDAFGTQLITAPGYQALFLANLYGGQFGTDLMRSPTNSPVTGATGYLTGTTAKTSTVTFSRYLHFEFAKAYGVISGANAALLPVLQLNTAAASALSTNTTINSAQETLDSDFYWLPSAPADPPGLGTTCQWILQPANPTVASSANQLVQLPRLGGYLTMLVFELRGTTGLRQADSAWPTRPKVIVDGVPLIDTLFTTWQEDLAISTGIGAYAAQITNSATGALTGTLPVPKPGGTIGLNRKTSLSQRDFGLLDTGEIFLNTNPGTQLEIAGYPWGTQSSGPSTLNAIVGQVVPSGTLIQGLPEV